MTYQLYELTYQYTDLCTSREAADYLGVNIKTVQRWADSGRLPAWRLGTQYLRFRRSDVENMRGQMAAR